VQVLPQADMSLLIVPRRELAEAEKSEATIEITQEMDKDAALRLFISYYLAGYDIVRLRSPRYDPGLRSYMREAIRRKLVGIESIGLTSARDCLGYRLAVKSVERVGDHAAAVAELVSGVQKGAAEKAMKDVEKMSDLSLKEFGDSVSSLLRLDRKLANEAIGL